MRKSALGAEPLLKFPEIFALPLKNLARFSIMTCLGGKKNTTTLDLLLETSRTAHEQWLKVCVGFCRSSGFCLLC